MVYVDIEPVAVAHTELMLADNENADVIQGDLLDPETILSSAPARQLNLDEPVAVLMVAVLHFMDDDNGPTRRRRPLRRGHGTRQLPRALPHRVREHGRAGQARNHYQKNAVPILGRTREQLATFFTGTEILEPGIVWIPQWHPETLTLSQNQKFEGLCGRRPQTLIRPSGTQCPNRRNRRSDTAKRCSHPDGTVPGPGEGHLPGRITMMSAGNRGAIS